MVCASSVIQLLRASEQKQMRSIARLARLAAPMVCPPGRSPGTCSALMAARCNEQCVRCLEEWAASDQPEYEDG